MGMNSASGAPICFRKPREFVANGIVDRLVKTHQIHLVDRHHEVPDAQQIRNERMPARLGQHAVAGVDQDDGQVRRGCAGRHVARILLVARRVGDDEFAFRRGEISIRDVDGDALLAFGAQAVGQQRQIDMPPLPLADALATLAS